MWIAPPEAAADLYVKAYRAGLKWPRVLERAGVHRSTWKRIEERGTYLSATLDRIASEIEKMLLEAVPANDTAGHEAPPDPAIQSATTQETAHGATGRDGQPIEGATPGGR